MAEIFKPYAYQEYAIQRIIDTPRIGNFQDMGLGKTVCTLTALHELKYYRFCIKKVLVIAPKKVAEATWTNEVKKWEHLKDLKVSVVIGTSKKRIAALNTPADIYVINRDNTRWLVNYYGRNWPFDVVVLDESSSFKNPKTKRFQALKMMLPKINRIIELTGTPAPRNLLDLWSQIYLLDGGKRLGRTLSVYKDLYFDPGRRNRTTIFEYIIKDGAEQAIYDAIDDICISMKSEDYLDLPDLIINDIPVYLDEKAQSDYKRMETEMLLTVDENTITAVNAAALSGKLLQLCNGAVYDENGTVTNIHDCKIEAFMETIEQLNGQAAIVYYQFKHDKDRLLEALSKTELRVRVYENANDENDWNAGKIDILLAQPASCGYGLNLQTGGHNIIWFGLTWNLEDYLQANKRCHRQGQTHPVIVHRLIVRGGLDENVVNALARKDCNQESLLEALKVHISTVREGLKK